MAVLSRYRVSMVTVRLVLNRRSAQQKEKLKRNHKT